MTIGAEGTMVCDFDLKKSKNRLRISLEFIGANSLKETFSPTMQTIFIFAVR
tara:strand:+ start:61434 stop:61589 length:156 start_codon:yes stop_codon:yes gene_type:complete